MIEVTCAIIENEDGKVLVTQRSATMDLPLKWEFPGGKVEENETTEACLIREIKEELGCDIRVLKALTPHKHAYPDKTILLIPFICEQQETEIRLSEHCAFAWLKPEQLKNLDWADADIAILEEYLTLL
jgi:8-oxo-dGTP diphosphatase